MTDGKEGEEGCQEKGEEALGFIPPEDQKGARLTRSLFYWASVIGN
ncbi:MAG TPA: hypothetical protein VFO82_11545 [Steroidobacteraceae bacterium]|nr:hypothetical protein [Steroidobacteraceae bacterium]